jgi:hypothetical protein
MKESARPEGPASQIRFFGLAPLYYSYVLKQWIYT